ncbi:uncharacterized protein Dwil_GK18845 [Drosophila willistoni]|uniref:Uncharacterized protein n=1 Tax=Drosophila willistoni TaxID=7260 RepID=B4NEA3_DROWI|nr:uncharacterized protein LOC6648637 [Drosophila willistoni]EDW82072.1 uncharacterized protein Dwil_GK18845 [Drosophila willistoni]
MSRALSPLIRRCYSQIQGGSVGKKPKVSSGPGASESSSIPSVTGLSSNCVKSATSPVGPGASATSGYKVPEYFSFNRFSYAEAEVEMAKYRCPQPSALKK